MATTITRVPDGNDVWGRQKVEIRDYNFSNGSAYPAGGYAVAASDVGLKFLKAVMVGGGDVSLLTYFPVFDFGTTPAGTAPLTGKLRFYTATGVEATGNLSVAINIRLVCIGG